MRGKLGLLLTLVVILGLIASCTPRTVEVEKVVKQTVVVPEEVIKVVTPTPPPAGPKTLVICQAQEPDTLWWHGTSMLAARAVQHALYDPVTTGLTFDYQAGAPLTKLPSLADGDATLEKVQVKAGDPVVQEGNVITAEADMELDQMTVTFKWTEGMKWSDGEPVTAEDSVFSYEVNKDPDCGAPSTYLVDRTLSYEALDANTSKWTGLPGYTDSTYFLNYWVPLPKHILKDIPVGKIKESDYARKPVGYGPFVVKEWVSGDRIELERNPNYWRPGLPKVDKVIFRFIADTNQLIAQGIAGECDICTQDGLALDQAPFLDQAKANNLLNVYYVAGTVWEHIDFNVDPLNDRPRFWQDVRVRQAVAYGTDRQKMVDSVLYGRTQVLDVFVPSVHWAFPPAGTVSTYPFDPDKAKQLLEEAGWVLGDDGVRVAKGVQGVPNGTRFEVTFNTTSGNKMREQTSQIFQANMADIGIKINLEFLPSRVWLSGGKEEPRSTTRREWDIGMFAWLTGVMPSVNLYRTDNIPSPDNGFAGQNYPGYSNPEYDKVAAAAMQEIDRQKQIPLYHEAFKIWSAELPVMPLFARVKVGATRTNITGYVIDPTENSEMYNIANFDIE